MTAEFEKEVLAEIKNLKTANQAQQKTLLENYENLQKETKAAMEEFTKAKNEMRDIKEMSIAMAKLQVQLKREARLMVGATPMQRLLADPEARNEVRTWILRSLQLHAEAKGLAEGSTPGSTWIPNAEVEQIIYDTLLSYGDYKSLDVRFISTKSVDISVKTARPVAKFVDEAATITPDSTKAGSKSTLTPKKIAVLLSASTELLEDSQINAVQDVLNDTMEAIAFRIDTIAFIADGTSNDTYGGYTGLFAAGTAATAADTHTSVAATKYTDWLLCLTTVDAAVLKRKAQWWIHPTMLARSLAVKDDNGRPIFQTAIEAPSFGQIGSILGYPAQMVGVAPNVDGTSKKIAAFGDGNAQAVRIRREIKIDRSEHFYFDTDEIGFRATARAGTLNRKSTAIAVLNTPAS